jgi:hypothetical protein
MRDLLLIHAHADADAAAILAEGIERISLKQVSPWFSSDTSDRGGLRPGELWMDRLLAELGGTRIGIALLTKNSTSQPWLYFEAGHIAARDLGLVIPVTLGIESVNVLPGPLAMYQGFQLTDVRSVRSLFRKLMGEFKIAFDDDMATPVIESMMKKMATTSSLLHCGGKEAAPDAHADLKNHIDRRLATLAHTLVDVLSPSNAERSERGYDVKIKIRFPDLESDTFVRVEADTTAREILDNIFVALAGRVEPFKYLETWILREEETGLGLVIAEAAYFSLAHGLLPREVVWRAEPLTTPFDVAERRMRGFMLPGAAVFARRSVPRR